MRGKWRFDMVAGSSNPMKVPAGTTFGNRIVFLEMRAPDLLVFDHGQDKEDDETRFRVTVTFDEQADKTVVTMRQLHPTKEQRASASARWRSATRRSTASPTTCARLAEWRSPSAHARASEVDHAAASCAVRCWCCLWDFGVTSEYSFCC